FAACAEPAGGPDGPAAAAAEGPDAAEAGETDGPEPDGDTEEGVSEITAGGTVADAVAGGCSTTSVFGLSEQIVKETNCLVPGALAAMPNRSDFVKSAATFPFLQTPGRDALVKMLDADSRTFSVNSMLRTVAQQYLLFAWFQQGRCGIQAAATPGKSNHETGLALDTSDFSAFRPALEARGFKWFGSGDQVHFDFVGAGTKNLTGVGVRAFQRLWNLNNPGDLITVDGLYGPQTESRLRKSPAAGFAKGASCG
ncbi:MAG TPA: M15 family metallopeptidase, partial [Polyangiaceae bacterium]|nr:M15 family metallopeptidase [Polyangiaceae bacterium]